MQRKPFFEPSKLKRSLDDRVWGKISNMENEKPGSGYAEYFRIQMDPNKNAADEKKKYPEAEFDKELAQFRARTEEHKKRRGSH